MSTADPGGTDPAAPLRDVSPPDATARAFDALGLTYEHAFRDLAPLGAALDRLEAALAPGSRILDVGSGTGLPVAARLADAGHRVTGIDVSPRMVEIARRQVPNASFEQADVRTWPSPPGSWDAICAFFPLLTMPRPELEATLARFAAWLAPGGMLALATVPVDVDGVDGQFLGRSVRVWSFPADAMVARIRAAGLVIDREETTVFHPDFPGAIDEPHLFVDARAPRGGPSPG